VRALAGEFQVAFFVSHSHQLYIDENSPPSTIYMRETTSSILREKYGSLAMKLRQIRGSCPVSAFHFVWPDLHRWHHDHFGAIGEKNRTAELVALRALRHLCGVVHGDRGAMQLCEETLRTCSTRTLPLNTASARSQTTLRCCCSENVLEALWVMLECRSILCLFEATNTQSTFAKPPSPNPHKEKRDQALDSKNLAA
jgi:hypothetical protein